MISAQSMWIVRIVGRCCRCKGSTRLEIKTDGSLPCGTIVVAISTMNGMVIISVFTCNNKTIPRAFDHEAELTIVKLALAIVLKLVSGRHGCLALALEKLHATGK